MPFALIYLLDRGGASGARSCSAGIASEHPAECRDGVDSAVDDVWGWRECPRRDKRCAVGSRRSVRPAAGRAGHEEPTHTAVLLPLSRPGQPHPYGFLVAGVSPRRALDERYRDFFRLTADQIATGDRQRRRARRGRSRAEALAEIDRAKTAFFSNVSHEFRTPLTLMLGPIEDALGTPGHRVCAGEDLRAVHRNALRLLKLVNALLDFSRIEAGRVQASLRAGGSRRADGGPGERVPLGDRARRAALRGRLPDARPSRSTSIATCGRRSSLNLLSNAFKFTFEGTIRVPAARTRRPRRARRLRTRASASPSTSCRACSSASTASKAHARARTRARASGSRSCTSWCACTAARIERRRASSAKARRSPSPSRSGRAHLPQDRDRPRDPRSATHGRRRRSPSCRRRSRWLPDARPASSPASRAVPAPDAPGRSRRGCWSSDDNADMREYLTRLLSPQWTVRDCDGRRGRRSRSRARWPPELVLTDVMMPGLDGFGLLAALRGDARTRDIPVIMLSARAGEEARSRRAGGRRGRLPGQAVLGARAGGARRVTRIAARADARGERPPARAAAPLLRCTRPTPIVWFDGPEHVVELANPQHLALLGGRDASPGMKPLRRGPAGARGSGRSSDCWTACTDAASRTFASTPSPLDARRRRRSSTPASTSSTQPVRDEHGRDRGRARHRDRRHRRCAARSELSTLRAVAESRPPRQGRVPGDARPRAAQPARADPDGAAAHALRGDDGRERERTVIERQVDHLVRLVDDLLDVSRITRGKVELRKRAVELATRGGRRPRDRQPAARAAPAAARAATCRARACCVNGDPTARAGRLEPAHQRREVHASRDGRISVSAAERVRATLELRVTGQRHRIARRAAERLRAVRAGAAGARPLAGRSRPGPGDRLAV